MSSADKRYATSIDLPTEDVFRNLQNACHFAVDIGGSLVKVAYCSKLHRKTSHIRDHKEDNNSIYQILEEDGYTRRLHFIKFETKYLHQCLDFIRGHLMQSKEFMLEKKNIKATGGGAHKYKDQIIKTLGVQLDKEDEMECLINGSNFLLKNIPDEAFIYQRHGQSEYQFQGIHHDIFPYLLVNIGSGVSFVKVESETKYERIGGTSTGGGTFWGLGSLLTKAKTFDDLLELAEKGDHKKVDMLVRDIYGGEYSTIGLTGDIIASSFGKAARTDKENVPCYKDEDVARSLLLSISNDIGQLASLYCRLHQLKKIYFGGYFIRGHPLTMHTISFAINFWSKGEIQALFMRHEGYLGAIGAFLKGAEEEDTERYTWGENFAGCSGLSSSNPLLDSRERSSTFDMLELDKLEKMLQPCSLLLDPNSYLPDTVDLTTDTAAREYWIDCFSNSVDKTRDQALASQTGPDVKERAETFKQKYLQRLQELNDNPCAYGSLTVRSLLDTSSHCLSDCLFTDPYSQLKHTENEQALKCLPQLLLKLDGLSLEELQLSLAKGLLAGNVFDWGAREVVDMMENQDFGFVEAQDKLQERPWLCDNYEEWNQRLQDKPHKCAVIFVDNSGADIILGVFPFVRGLLRRGTKVILCANSRPALNDVIYSELLILVKRVAEISPDIQSAYDNGTLMVMDSGQGSPCLDLRLINFELVELMKKQEADLIVIEGMGRAIHTNFDAAFSCESLKVAVIKNRWLANRLGGDMFSVVFKYQKPQKIIAAKS
ncbi:4'-phosphopantetheine phosphatase-like [Mytilus trossulus]|uniref:4'-phosphopantetheine phosphatase-like n=1 Tax=Mytilus trossulus TaxID=6551 RepID=UPI0030076C3F